MSCQCICKFDSCGCSVNGFVNLTVVNVVSMCMYIGQLTHCVFKYSTVKYT